MSAVMKTRPIIPMQANLPNQVNDVGGEPLEGSGFEDEIPDPEFSETTLDAPEPPR
jgi:hypothetical protein